MCSINNMINNNNNGFRREIHQQQEQEDHGSGDGRSLIHEFTSQVNTQESTLNKIALSSLSLILTWFVAKQIVWISFIYEISKPIYIVYVSATLLVDVLAPAFLKFERWLTGDQLLGDAASPRNSDYFDFDEDILDEFPEEEEGVEGLNESRRTMIYQQLNSNVDLRVPRERDVKVRRLRSRRQRVGEARPLILKAIESELRKDIKVST